MDGATLLKALADRFEGYELVELLDISVEEIIDAFQDRIEYNFTELEDFLTNGR